MNLATAGSDQPPKRTRESVNQILQEVREVVRAAGRVIEDIRDSGNVDTQRKADDSPVTRADREADELLRQRLNGLLRAGWLSEETADDGSRLSEERLWVVDPLDGTREFIKGIAEFSIAVALVEHGEPVLGVVHNPASGDMFWAGRGMGAFRNGAPIAVKEGASLLTSRSELARGEFEAFAEDWKLIPVGSIQLKLALVAAAEGALTLSRGPKHEWDVCAGALIVSEAGGSVSDVYGGPLGFNQPFPKVKGILAGAPGAYSRGLQRVKAIGASDRMNEFNEPRAQRPMDKRDFK